MIKDSVVNDYAVFCFAQETLDAYLPKNSFAAWLYR